MTTRRDRWRAVGPGLLWAGAAIGGSHLVQSTRAGASWGFDLVWVVVLILVVKYPFFEFAHRYTAATGESLLHGYRRLGRGALGVFFAIAALSSLINAAAVTLVTAGLCGTLFGLDWSAPWLALVVFMVVLAILLVGRYGTLDRAMKLMITALGALTIAAVAVAFSHGPAGDPAYAKPDLWNVAGLAFLLALMGWMPAPLDIAAWSSLWILAKDKEEGGHVSVEASRFDFNLGYVVTGVLALFFVSFGALVMFGTGKTFAGGGLAFSRQLIDMYESTLGTWSGRAIGIVAFITMFSTSLTVCDGYTRTLIGCWRLARAGEQWPRTEAAGSRRSYAALLLVICAVSWLIIATWLRGLTAMVDFATILAFLTAPVVAWLNLAVARLGNMPAEHRPGRRMTVFSWVGIAYLTGFGVVYLVNLALA